MKHRYVLFCLVVALALIMLLSAGISLADAGSFSGDTDWGGDSDWDSGSSWGDDSDWGSDYNSDSGSSWGTSSGSTYYDNGGDSYSTGGGCLGDSVITVIVIVVIAVVVLRNMKKNGSSSEAQQMYTATFEGEGLPIDQLKAKDGNFNEQKLLEKVGNVYIQMQDAWEQKKWEPMRAFLTDALYSQMDRQLDELRKNKLTNHVDKIAILETRILKYMVEADNDVLVVRLSTRITDYTTSDKNGEIVSGSNTAEKFMVYDWKMIRSAKMKTPDEEHMSHVSCPSCGAPLSVNAAGQCEYCGTVVQLSDHDWALSAIKGISQRTNG